MSLKYYHPVTGLYYRKCEDGTFELPAKKRFFCSKQLWKKSGMNSGFHISLVKIKNLAERDLIVKQFYVDHQKGLST